MQKRYADWIISIMGSEPNIKRVLVREDLINQIGLDQNQLPVIARPSDLPTVAKAGNKFSNFRRSGYGRTKSVVGGAL